MLVCQKMKACIYIITWCKLCHLNLWHKEINPIYLEGDVIDQSNFMVEITKEAGNKNVIIHNVPIV